MPKYPIKLLLDFERKPFFPLVTTDAVVVNGSDKTAAELFADRYTKDEVDEIIRSLGTIQRLCGKLNSKEELPKDAKPGDTYIIINPTGDNEEYMFVGDEWEKLGSLLELDDYFTAEEVSAMLKEWEATIRSKYTAADSDILEQAKMYTDNQLLMTYRILGTLTDVEANL